MFVPQKRNTMKKWIYVTAGYVLLLAVISLLLKQKGSYEDNWKTAEANVKAYDELLSLERNKSTAYQLTADQLSYAKDSILRELDSIRAELGIKDSNLKALQKIRSTFSKSDTIVMNDTVLRAVETETDTIVGDEWYSVGLSLKYPSTIIVTPRFKSDKSIVVGMRKETVKPRSKWWIVRIFQKKHKVLTVDVLEKNPYVTDESSRYVEIVK